MPSRETLIAQLREFLQDYAAKNILTGEMEFSDEELSRALDWAADDFNSTPPILEPYTPENFPSISLLMKGAALYLLRSSLIRRARNMVIVQDGATALQPQVNAQMIGTILQELKQDWEMAKRQLKVSLNIAKGFDTGSGGWRLDSGYFK